MTRTIVIDDEVSGRELAAGFLQQYCPSITVVGMADSVASGYSAICEYQPELVFLDIRMTDGTGFDLLRRFDAPDFRVVFVTAYEQYALEAFRFCALDYLLKPLSPRTVMQVVDRADRYPQRMKEDVRYEALMQYEATDDWRRRKIILRTSDKLYAVNIGDILRMESDGSYTLVYTAEGKQIIVSRQLKEFDAMLSPAGFLRVHQSHLVNLEHLYCFDKQSQQLILRDDSIVPVSSRKRDQVMQIFSA